MTVKEYLRRKYALSNTTFRITPDGKGFFIVNGALIPQKEFIEQNRLPVDLKNYEQPNPDKTKDWMRA